MLTVEAVETAYGLSQVLFGVSLRVDAGAVVTLLGRNGMGKTTTVRTIMGIVPPRAGRIHFDDRPIHGLPSYRVAQAGIGLVPEGRQVFPNLTVRENLVMAAREGADGRRDWDLERALATFPRLAERIGHMGGQISGGEQQMLTIGRALMTNPDLLILDEATEGLAPKIAREIWQIVRRIRESGIATVVVDKNFAAVNAATDRNLILVKGEVVYEGVASDLRAKPEIHRRYLGV